MRHDTGSEVDVYPTGVLAELLIAGRLLNPGWMRRHPWPSWLPRHPDADRLRDTAPHWRRHALGRLRRQLPAVARRRHAWRGYYAEPRTFPPGVDRLGTGWSRRRALADLERRIAEAGR